MTTCARKAKTMTLNDRIDILERNAVEASPAKQVFGTATAILTLVRVSVIILRPPVNPR